MARHRKTLKVTDRWAFWPYDLFPFMLGSVINPNPPRTCSTEGAVYLDAYMGFVKPFTIVDGLPGAKLQADLEQLREDHSLASKALDKEYRDRLVARLEEAGVHHPRINPLPEPA